MFLFATLAEATQYVNFHDLMGENSEIAFSVFGLPIRWYALAYLAGIFELVAGIFILVGFQTRIAAYLLAAFSVFTALVFHSGSINVPDFPEGANGLLTVFNGLMMWKNITIAGGFLVLAAFGPGALSIDGRRAAA